MSICAEVSSHIIAARISDTIAESFRRSIQSPVALQLLRLDGSDQAIAAAAKLSKKFLR